ncbi:MAG: hypothetical protein KC621_34930 [Myxococcales bacterium]|nr:hypothetical protein [Myxococcales bacterium]
MLWWSVLAARAGVVGDLGSASARYPDDAVVSCAPLSDLVAALPSLPLPPGLSTSTTGRMVLELMDPARSAELGIDPGGPVTLVTREKQDLPVELALPFSGTEAQASALVHRFDPTAEGGDGIWSLVIRGRPFLVVHEPGRSWSLVSGSTRPPAPVTTLPAALEGLPEVAGCAMYLPGLPRTDRLHLAIEEVAGFVPLHGGAPGTIRFVVEEPLGPLWTASDVPLSVGRSADPPDAIAVVSVPLQDLFTALAAAQGSPELAEQLQRHVSLPSGAVMAAWGDPRSGGRWAAISEILDRRGRPFSPRRLSRLATRALRHDMVASRFGRDGVAMGVGGQVVYARFAEDGRVALGNDPLAPSVALATAGAPWIDEDRMSLMNGGPLTIRSTGPVSVDLVLRAAGERVVELVVDVHLDPTARTGLQQALQPVLDAAFGAFGDSGH